MDAPSGQDIAGVALRPCSTLRGRQHGRPGRAPLVTNWLTLVPAVCTPSPEEGVQGTKPTPTTGPIGPVTTQPSRSDGKGAPGSLGDHPPTRATGASTPPGFGRTEDPTADTASAPDPPDNSDPRTYTITLDWRNNSFTGLRRPLLEPYEYPTPSPGHPVGPPAWKIWVTPSMRMDGSPRRAGHTLIAKALVDAILEADSPEVNCINVFSLLWMDTCELIRPCAVGWVGGIRLDSE